MQARAEATRRRILDAAVRLFSDRGYGETSLADIVEAAKLSKGAFYYHFASKEDVAAAIIDDYDRKLAETVVANIDPTAPSLGDMIRSTFAVQALQCWDESIQVGQTLMQGFEQISSGGRRVTIDWTDKFVYMVAGAVAAGELVDGVNADEVGEAIWITVLGAHVLSGALMDNPFARLARSWRFILRSVAPPSSLPDYDGLLNDLVIDYTARPEYLGMSKPDGDPAAEHSL